MMREVKLFDDRVDFSHGRGGFPDALKAPGNNEGLTSFEFQNAAIVAA